MPVTVNRKVQFHRQPTFRKLTMNTLFAVTGSAFRLVASACAVAALCMPSHADVLVSNIDVPIRGITALSQDLWAAQAFNTDASAYRLDSIEVLLGSLTGDLGLVAELHADAGGSPGSTLASLALAGVGTGAPADTVLPGSFFHLSANTAYWLVLGATGSGGFGWAYAQGNAQTGPGSLGGYAYSTDAGASWNPFAAYDPYNIRVNVSSVPEPSIAGLLLVGLLSMWWLQARRVRAEA